MRALWYGDASTPGKTDGASREGRGGGHGVWLKGETSIEGGVGAVAGAAAGDGAGYCNYATLGGVERPYVVTVALRRRSEGATPRARDVGTLPLPAAAVHLDAEAHLLTNLRHGRAAGCG
eukprot:gene12513-biopygen1368